MGTHDLRQQPARMAQSPNLKWHVTIGWQQRLVLPGECFQDDCQVMKRPAWAQNAGAWRLTSVAPKCYKTTLC
jgi:hypothetical protein